MENIVNMEKTTVKSSEVTEMLVHNSTGEVGASLTDPFLDEVENFLTFKASVIISTYWSPILSPIGLVGNVLSFLIMVKPNNRKLSTCIYMAAISINDSMMMFLVFYGWSENYFNFKIHKHDAINCKVQSFLVMFA